MRRDKLVPRLAPLALAFNALGIGSVVATPSFNLDFLRGNANQRDIAALSSPGAILPGRYPFAVFLNGDEVAREDIDFLMTGSGQAEPCLLSDHLHHWGVRLRDTIPDNAPNGGDAPHCVPLAQMVPGASVSYNGNQQRLDLRVPQASLVNLPRGYIPRALRDQGINALLVDYAVNGTHNQHQTLGRDNYLFASINSTLNAGMWRFRHSTNANRAGNGQGTRWKTQAFRAETDFGSLRSRITLGDTYTAYGAFDSVQFRGAQLANDDEMLPFSQRNYAPVVRGVAASGARVEVRQDGSLIYALNVAPGPFEIADIVPYRMSGELEVSIIQADGAVQRYKQPFSAVETMLRPGLLHYELSAGELRNGHEGYEPRFLQATAARGTATDTTPYGGLLLSENYSAVAIGAAQNLGRFGSASIDVTHARTHLAQGNVSSGESYRFLYSKSLNTSGTEFRLIGHRYSTSGYYDFSDASAERAQWRHGYYEASYSDSTAPASESPWAEPQEHFIRSERFNNKRNRLELALNQRITDGYALNASYTSQNYWGANEREQDIQLGLNGHVGAVNYGLFFRQGRRRHERTDRSLGFSLSVPLDRAGTRRSSATASYNHSSHSGASYQTGINGALLDGDSLGYNLNLGRTDAGNSGSANLRYLGRTGIATLGATQARNYSQINWGLRGGWVLHHGGLTLAQSLQRTNVLVHARDGAGIGIENQAGIKLDRNGYGLVSGVSAYRSNRIALRTNDLGADIDASRISSTVVPTRGALARVEFETRRGLSLMVHPIRVGDLLVPLGAGVFGSDGLSRGIAGPHGEIFVSGVHPGEVLSVRWGATPDQRCDLHLEQAKLTSEGPGSPGYRHIELHCLAPTNSQ